LASIDRVIQLARAVLDRLDAGDRVSVILPQARLVAEARGDKEYVHWIDCELYGLPAVPFAKKPRRATEERAACLLFIELRGVEDVEKLSADEVVAGKRPDPSRKGKVLCQSVGELERSVAEHRETPPDYTGWSADQILQAWVLQRERVLDRVRVYLHKYVGGVWLWAQQERNNVKLLGPDYRIVVDSLEALETGVGEELLAALGNLRGENPANWALAALACRNVILKLGRTLLVSDEQVYQSELAGRPLNLRGEMEKNKLCAFIDWHFRRSADESVKSELKRLDEVVRSIYEKGSKGKSTTRHGEAQQLVIDTFDFVSALERLTGLQPVTYP